ncbi:flagellar hook-basal body complex protein FliE [Lutibaculum baratangense]|uniref:Flagellar hook-basal body complex protein FliE n=1 Tax=Lutibaculum baratangense AMV1 TaxID=631454 RepID=V4TLX5_9HYPH|nr:flagellar hook-basal body complex protein FliE [Lutibaculum baratangense]ESR26788.1 Flagellar hook-basal body complex protein FliE [Lutibaculum baratangense AMV1]
MTPAIAAKAYSKLAGGATELPGRAGGAGEDFAAMLKTAMADVAQTGAVADKASLNAAAGQGNLVDVITAVSASELNMQTVVTLRDRVIESYQQIMQMPI